MSDRIPLPSPSAQNREFIFEMMGFIRLTAEAAQLSCQLADDAALEHQLRRMIATSGPRRRLSKTLPQARTRAARKARPRDVDTRDAKRLRRSPRAQFRKGPAAE